MDNYHDTSQKASAGARRDEDDGERLISFCGTTTCLPVLWILCFRPIFFQLYFSLIRNMGYCIVHNLCEYFILVVDTCKKLCDIGFKAGGKTRSNEEEEEEELH